MRLSMSLTMGILLMLVSFQAFAAYDVVDRFKIASDRFHTERFFRPLDHRWNFDFGVAANRDLETVIKEGEEISEQEGGDAARIAAGLDYLNRYNNTEQFINVNTTFGIPLWTFRALGAKWVPDLRFTGNIDALLAIREEAVNSIADFLPSNTPDRVLELAGTISADANLGADISVVLEANTNDELILAWAGNNREKYYVPADLTHQSLFMMAKGDAKAGLFMRWTNEQHWLGYFNLYGLARTDRRIRVSNITIARNTESVAEIFGPELNIQTSVAADAQIAYRNRNWTTSLSVDEIKLVTTSHRKDEAGDLEFGYDPLFRLNTIARFNLPLFRIDPFAGFTIRDGYGIGESWYLGAILKAYIWNDKVGLQFRTMVDPEHLSLVPKIKLWFMHVEYSLKIPVQDDVDDNVKVSSIHSVNIRFSI